MNAVIALCHFCELHGPSMLFCTQTFHDSESQGLPAFEESIGGIPLPSKRYYGPSSLLRHTSVTVSSKQPDSSIQLTNPLGMCEGCTSMYDDQRGFISTDHDARISYISSQCPMHPEVFSTVRQACVRSLSCEVCPGREGPIYFGDDQRGHVLSHTFFMKDSQARGFQRWYSIMVVIMDKYFLLNYWPFLVKYLQEIIAKLQTKANKVYEDEQAECSQRATRLNNVTHTTPNNFRRHRGSSKARSLIELTRDKEIFTLMHLWFTWILRAGADHFSERVLEGIPIEDIVVDLEQQEETEEGFIKVHEKRASLAQVESMPETLDDNKEDSSQRGIQEIVQLLGKDIFHILAYHTVVGNQIILRGRLRNLIRDIFTSLKELLPYGCYHPIFYSDVYEDSWKCNFLGLSEQGPIPSHILSSNLHLCIDLSNTGNSNAEDGSRVIAHIVSSSPVPTKVPQVLSEMERTIYDTSFSKTTLKSNLLACKETWMNKAKMLFAFSRHGRHSKEEMQQLLKILGAQQQDKEVLQFWMTGLSMQFKMHVLSSSMQRDHSRVHDILS